jgi:hypothetical protein
MLGGLFRGMGIKIASGDLDDCLGYLADSVPSHIRVEAASTMWREIEQWLPQVIEGSIDAAVVSQRFTAAKNDYLFGRGLKNHKDPDFCVAYLLSCFFMFVKTGGEEESKVRATRMLNFIEKNFDSQLAGDNHAKAAIKALKAGFSG